MKKFFRARLWEPSPLAFLALFFLVGNSWALSVKELISLSRQMIVDTGYYSNVPRITDSRIIGYLNEGQDFASAYSWAFHQRLKFDLLPQTTEYAVPQDFLTADRVTLDEVIIWEMTLPALDGEGNSWINSAGRPNAYYIRTTTWTVIGFNPVPADSNSIGTITLDYITKLRKLANPNDVPFNGGVEYEPLHPALAKFVAYRYYLSIGNQPMADIYAKEYASDIKQMKTIVESKPNYRPGAQGGRSGRP